MNNIELQKEIAVLQTTVQGLKQERDELAAMFAVMRAGYAECLDDLKDWSSYADDYFKDKWKLSDDIAKHEKALSLTGPAALHEIRAQVLDELSSKAGEANNYVLEHQLREMAAAERAKGGK